MGLFATCVYLWGNLPVRLATQRKSLCKFNLPRLATTCESVWPRLNQRNRWPILIFYESTIFFFLFHKSNHSNYSLTHSASELSGFISTSSPTMNEKFSIPHEAAKCGIENFEFIVRERVQVNPDNSRAMSALTFLLFKLNKLPKRRQTFSESAEAMV